ncbi:hypothetical protein R3P38DRAFT_3221567 [Favolaschia claudopus]|uniref:Uncharacterized protein n=1 Tax=Favolaschia claudopus TaxID=2862362 RepID=A0AAW0A0G2_9AGAR
MRHVKKGTGGTTFAAAPRGFALYFVNSPRRRHTPAVHPALVQDNDSNFVGHTLAACPLLSKQNIHAYTPPLAVTLTHAAYSPLRKAEVPSCAYAACRITLPTFYLDASPHRPSAFAAGLRPTLRLLCITMASAACLLDSMIMKTQQRNRAQTLASGVRRGCVPAYHYRHSSPSSLLYAPVYGGWHDASGSCPWRGLRREGEVAGRTMLAGGEERMVRAGGGYEGCAGGRGRGGGRGGEEKQGTETPLFSTAVTTASSPSPPSSDRTELAQHPRPAFTKPSAYGRRSPKQLPG